MPSPDRLTAEGAALLVVDVQEKLVSRLRYGPLVIANAERLVRASALLGIPVFATEQYPRGLGPTVPALADLIPDRPAKTSFHGAEAPGLVTGLIGRAVRHVTLVGIESHICIAQTALELIHLGYRVQIPADAVASRAKLDWEFALRRLERAGAILSTTESVLFEWTESSDHPAFKQISALVKDFVPPHPSVG